MNCLKSSSESVGWTGAEVGTRKGAGGGTSSGVEPWKLQRDLELQRRARLQGGCQVEGSNEGYGEDENLGAIAVERKNEELLSYTYF